MKVVGGNAINRQYKFLRKIKRTSLTGIGTTLPAAGACAYKQNIPGMLVSTMFCFSFIKLLEFVLNDMARIKPDYKAIVKRAKQIKAANRKLLPADFNRS